MLEFIFLIWLSIPVQPLNSYVALGKFLNIFEG